MSAIVWHHSRDVAPESQHPFGTSLMTVKQPPDAARDGLPPVIRILLRASAWQDPRGHAGAFQAEEVTAGGRARHLGAAGAQVDPDDKRLRGGRARHAAGIFANTRSKPASASSMMS